MVVGKTRRGQVLPLGVLFTIMVLLPMLGSVAMVEAVSAHGGAQIAADAAATAAAQQTTVTEQVDALGNIYGYTVIINPGPATTAAGNAWNNNTDLLMGATTTGFHVSFDNTPPSGSPATVNVVGTLSFPDPLARLIGMSSSVTMTVQATAGTCGSVTWPGSFSPWCSQTS